MLQFLQGSAGLEQWVGTVHRASGRVFDDCSFAVVFQMTDVVVRLLQLRLKGCLRRVGGRRAAVTRGAFLSRTLFRLVLPRALSVQPADFLV